MKIFDDISPKDIRYLLAIMQEENLARAAESLGLTQTTLTYAVKRLEDKLKAPLFTRTARGMHPSDAARGFALKAELLLKQWEVLPHAFRSTDSIAGLFSLGCHPVVGMSILPSCLSEMLKRYPGLHFNIEAGVSRHIQALVGSGRLDFGIVVNPSESSELVVRPIGEDVFGIWVDQKIYKMDSLKGSPKLSLDLLYYDPDLFQSMRILDQLQNLGLTPHKMVQVNGLELTAALAADGAAALLPARIAKRYPSLVAANWRVDKTSTKKNSNAKLLTCLDRFALVYQQKQMQSAGFKKLARELELNFKSILSK